MRDGALEDSGSKSASFSPDTVTRKIFFGECSFDIKPSGAIVPRAKKT
jgi:hypothetical protein